MRHHDSTKKFGRERKVRNGLMKSLALSLITKGKIKTTDTKARALRPYVEKMVTVGKKNTLAARRDLVAGVGVIAAERLVKDIAPKYIDRKGGYTRITKLPQRMSDGSFMAVIEFV